MPKNIFWDFDGVLLNSNSVRDYGFEQVLADYPQIDVLKLLEYHKKNGGLSRYVKFRYFFEEIRGEKVSQERIIELSEEFSIIMRNTLVNEQLLIHETLDFIRRNFSIIDMHIVSGSDQNELRFLCDSFGITKYFKSIKGSPIPKNDLVYNILNEYGYSRRDCVLVGDSINDYIAAKENGIKFVGYNNEEIEKLTTFSMTFDV